MVDWSIKESYEIEAEAKMNPVHNILPENKIGLIKLILKY